MRKPGADLLIFGHRKDDITIEIIAICGVKGALSVSRALRNEYPALPNLPLAHLPVGSVPIVATSAGTNSKTLEGWGNTEGAELVVPNLGERTLVPREKNRPHIGAVGCDVLVLTLPNFQEFDALAE